MSMNKMLIAGIAGTFLAGSAAMAMEPVKLTDGQMDDVTAGARLVLGIAFTGGGYIAKQGGPTGPLSFVETSRTRTYESDTLTVKENNSGITASGSSLVKTNAYANTSASGRFGGGAGEIVSYGTFAASGALSD